MAQRRPGKGQRESAERCGAGFREEGSEQKVCEDELSDEKCQCGEPDAASGAPWGSETGPGGFRTAVHVGVYRAKPVMSSTRCFRRSEQNPRDA